MAFLIVLILVAAAGYYVSLRIHPFTKCRVCNGGGKHFGAIYTYAHRKCTKCGGTGRKDRLGVRLFFGGTDSTGAFNKR